MGKKLFLLGLILAVIGLSYQFSKNEILKIGFVAGLSGKYSTLGQSVLNGFTLALDEVSYKIKDKDILLIQKDDKQDVLSAKKAMSDFKKDGVKLIIGNTTSSMTKVSIPYINESRDMFLFSPTASSNEFSNIDDNFFRTQVAHSTKRFDKLSQFLLNNNKKRIYTIYDPNNKSYVDNYLVNFQSSYINNGGNKFVTIEKISTDFNEIVKDINSKNIDAITIVANSIDSAKIIQFLRLKNINQIIIAAGWAKTKDFLENGGSAVNGVVFSTGYDDNSQEPKYLEFVQKYVKKYNSTPSVFSAQAYETGKIILEILEKDSNIENIKSNILAKKEFDGLQGKIIFNQYGDVDREYFLMKVENNNFIKIRD